MKTLFPFFLLTVAAIAQPVEIENILNNNAYLVGRGEDRDFSRADELALKDLVSQISVSVESSFLDVKQETNMQLSEFTQAIVKSYSSAVLTNAERKIETLPGGKYRVYRYIRKTDRNKIYNQREDKIRNYVKTGLRAEDANDFDISLRSFYWALVLLQSHPERNGINSEINGESQLLAVFLPYHIQGMLNKVKVKAENVSAGSGSNAVYISAFNERGRINNLGLKYFDGGEFIEATVKDGKGIIYLPREYHDNVSEVSAMIDYQFLHLLGNFPLDEEVKMVAEYIFIPFDNQTRIIIRDAQVKVFEPEIKKGGEVDDDHLIKMTQSVIEAIKSREFEQVRGLFSDAGYTQFLKIMNYGKVSLYQGEHPIDFVRFGDRILIRTIPLVIELTGHNRKVIYDDICPIVENGKIVWTNFAINDEEAEDVFRRGKISGDLQERLLCLTFMEYYKPFLFTTFSDSPRRLIDMPISGSLG